MRVQVDPHEQVDALGGAVEDLAGQFTLQPLLRRILQRAVRLLGGDGFTEVARIRWMIESLLAEPAEIAIRVF
jgi:hypothetical protein